MNQQENYALQQQVRHISHEIRNNISICDVYSEIIKKHLKKDGIVNPSIDNALNCIQNAIKLVGNSLVDLKGFSNLSVKIIESDKLVSECIEMSKIYAGEKEIVFTSDLLSNAKIFADEYKLKACLINIIKNSIEAIDISGFVKIGSYAEDDTLIISVSNNGKPIPDSEKAKLFNDGFTTKQNGSGVGLYLCKQNLQEFEGDVYLKSSDKNITEFIVKLKIAK